MTAQWTILVKLALLFGTLFGVAEWLHQTQHVPAEHTRKVVHAGTGLLTLLFPVWLTAWWQAAVLCGGFLVILVVTKRVGLLNSIHGVARKTVGSALYPVIVALAFAFYGYGAEQFTHFRAPYYFYMPVLILALADPAAALVGRWYGQRRGVQTGKTGAGSGAFFVVALLVSGLLIQLFGPDEPTLTKLLLTISIAVVTMLAERYGRHGWDNFFIPLATMGVQGFFELAYR